MKRNESTHLSPLTVHGMSLLNGSNHH